MNRITIWLLVLLNVGIWAFSTHNSNIHFSNLYKRVEDIARTERMVLDMQIRTFHYVRPHKGRVDICPECNSDSFSHLTIEEIHKELERRDSYIDLSIEQAETQKRNMDIESPAERERIKQFRQREADDKWKEYRGK